MPIEEMSSPEDRAHALKELRQSSMFNQCSDDQLGKLVGVMSKRSFTPGEMMMMEGQPQQEMFVLLSGEVERLHHDKDQRTRQVVDRSEKNNVIGSLHVMRQDKAYATLHCVSHVNALILPTEKLLSQLHTNAALSDEVIYSLSRTVRKQSHQLRTPFLRSDPKTIHTGIPFMEISLASSIESFYRSSMNATLNHHLTGSKEKLSIRRLLPNMHVQVPSRVAYINGFKGLRHYLSVNFPETEISKSPNPQLLRYTLAVVPGIIMTPLSSILEACNITQSTEPLHTRWIRGITFRCGREVRFGHPRANTRMPKTFQLTVGGPVGRLRM